MKQKRKYAKDLSYFHLDSFIDGHIQCPVRHTEHTIVSLKIVLLVIKAPFAVFLISMMY